MWLLKVNAPDKEAQQLQLKPGTITVGRLSTNEVVVDDVAASRRHAEITFNPAADTVKLVDLGSTNGTYVNRQRVTDPLNMQSGDVIRIGQVTIYLSHQVTEVKPQRSASGTHRFTRELLLESLDQHAILLYDTARRLNTVTDRGSVEKEVTDQITKALGVNHCRLVFAKDFNNLESFGFHDPQARQAVNQLSAEVLPVAMYVPVVSGEEPIALLCLVKTNPDARPFDQRDMQLVVAVSHQTALALQRIDLLDKVRKQEQVQNLLRRFLAPQEAQFLLRDYLETGHLPELAEQTVTVLFSDIVDSTGIAERVGARAFASILSTYYQTVTELIFKHGGIVRYLGDGVMAVFMRTPEHPDAEEHAVLAGREMIGRLNTTGALNLNQRYVIGISINTGPVMIGYVGTADRAELTVLGDTVNVAYRIQEYARPYKIVVGPATVAAIVDKFNTQRIGAVTLRGREKPIQVYEVLP
jgi:class 3 adenylate cyclase